MQQINTSILEMSLFSTPVKEFCYVLCLGLYKMLLFPISLILLGLLIVFFKQRLVPIMDYFMKVKKLPSSNSHLLLGHIGDILSLPRDQMVEGLISIVRRSPSPFVFWIGPFPALILHKPDHLKVLLSNLEYIDKPMQYDFQRPWLLDGLLLSKGKKWHSRRKIIIPTFRFSILEGFLDVYTEKAQILVKKLEKEIGCGGFNVHPYIQMCAMDIVCETIMGLNVNAQKDQGDNENSTYIKAVRSVTEELSRRTLRPWLYPDFIYRLTAGWKIFNTATKLIHDLSQKVIHERRRLHVQKNRPMSGDPDIGLGLKGKVGLLDLLLDVSENGKKLSDEAIREEVNTIMFAGHDTTATAVSFTLLMIASHPHVQEKIWQELQDISHTSTYHPSYKDLNDMKYLEMVINESLRLYPPAPVIARQPQEDILIDGHVIPAGMTIIIPIIITHRDSHNFPDPETFNPDNFLPEKVAKRHSYAHIPFSAGPRNCIGYKFAMLEMKVLLSSIVRSYKLERAGSDLVLEPNLILSSVNGINIKITPRSIY